MEAAAARPRDAWGATGGAVRAASRGLRPGLQPRFPRTRGARGLGATAHAEGSGPGAAFPGWQALERSRAPGRLSLRPGDSVGKPGPELGGQTLGRTRRERLPHGQGSKAPPPRGRDPQPRANLMDWKQVLPLTPRASFRCLLISSGPWAQRGF